MKNAVFGKTNESERKRIEMKLVSSNNKSQKLINRTTFKYFTEYQNKNIIAVTFSKNILNFCQPIYIGFSVLDIPKTLMGDYHYNVMKYQYWENIILMYTDTDSLVYFIKTKDFYIDLKNNPILLDRLDSSDLSIDHPCHPASKKKVPGFFSDEIKRGVMPEFVALRANAYDFAIEGEKKKKIKAKGIQGHVVINHMTVEDYKRCLFDDTNQDKFIENVLIRYFQHQIKTIKSENSLTITMMISDIYIYIYIYIY